MGQETDGLPRDAFLDALRDDLNHLYGAEHLRTSPLAVPLGVANRFDTASALRKILSEAIESLKPRDDTPPQARGWLVYEALFGCYVQQLGQKIVADQLGISVRQLRRELHSAAENLADELWRRYCSDGEPSGAAGEPSDEKLRRGDDPTIYEELAWLRDAPPERPTALPQAVLEAFELAHALSAERGIQLVSTVPDGILALAVHPIALCQALLSLLTVAIAHTAPRGTVHVTARPAGWHVVARIESETQPAMPSPMSDDDDNLAVARHLAHLCSGSLLLSGTDGEPFSATLALPALEQVPVLAIDDHTDTLRLLQRYTAGTRFRLLTTGDVEEAFALAGRACLKAIVLDVMMPQMDGWHVLRRLQAHPAISDVPVVVCTILAQEALALSLGASDFIRKPVTRQALLAALDRLVAQAPAPR